MALAIESRAESACSKLKGLIIWNQTHIKTTMYTQHLLMDQMHQRSSILKSERETEQTEILWYYLLPFGNNFLVSKSFFQDWPVHTQQLLIQKHRECAFFFFSVCRTSSTLQAWANMSRRDKGEFSYCLWIQTNTYFISRFQSDAVTQAGTAAIRKVIVCEVRRNCNTTCMTEWKNRIFKMYYEYESVYDSPIMHYLNYYIMH